MLCISYLFTIIYHNMQKLNKAVLKYVIFLLNMSMLAPFTYFYFDMELIIGIGIL